MEKSLLDLMAEYAAKGQIASFRLFEGRDQFLTVYEEILKETKGEILYMNSFILFGGVEYEKTWIKRRIRKKNSHQNIGFPS